MVFLLDFLSISNWIFTSCVACKNSVRNRQRVELKDQVQKSICELEISKTKCRWIGGDSGQIFDFRFMALGSWVLKLRLSEKATKIFMHHPLYKLCQLQNMVIERMTIWILRSGLCISYFLSILLYFSFPEKLTQKSWPPVDLYLISEKSIWKNHFRGTGVLVYFELDFYSLFSLQKSISMLIFTG